LTPPVGPGRPFGPSISSFFAVEIELFFLDLTADLDNLAKPILDTLFTPLPNLNQEPFRDISGVLFDAPDAQVFRLCLSKTRVSEPKNLGARIKVLWTNDDPDELDQRFR
jgi:hypothetical protein